jgi:hypothetical protein
MELANLASIRHVDIKQFEAAGRLLLERAVPICRDMNITRFQQLLLSRQNLIYYF